MHATKPLPSHDSADRCDSEYTDTDYSVNKNRVSPILFSVSAGEDYNASQEDPGEPHKEIVDRP